MAKFLPVLCMLITYAELLTFCITKFFLCLILNFKLLHNTYFVK